MPNQPNSQPVRAWSTLVAGSTGTNGVPVHVDSSGDVQVDIASALPAGSNLVGRVSASAETSTVYNGTTAVTPVFAAISGSTSGDNTLVAADSTKKIRVFALSIVAASAVNVRFESAAGGTALTGVMSFAANGGYVLPFNPAGWFETAANQLLNMELGGNVQVSGHLTYGLV